jgi:carbon monoxide dehydrogenase subunit G
MIETEQSIVIAASIERIWAFVEQIPNWAGLMPGLQDCTVIDASDSRWVLKVGVGGMVRTVKVDVHVDQWDGPERALFSFKLAGDPVAGGGAYTATRRSATETEIALAIRVVGSGPMAPMWEAMGRPLLPTFVRGFAGQLKAEIEKAPGPVAADPAQLSLLARISRWLRRLLKPADPPELQP